MKEVEYYDEIAQEIVNQFRANLHGRADIIISPLIGEISSSLRTLIANGYDAGQALVDFAHRVHRLHLDISIVVENSSSGKFEIIIFEIKRVKNLGLTELSQLIGYCLVSKCRFGILMNVNTAVSSEFSIILDADKDITSICRKIGDDEIVHEFGVMVWNHNTKRIEYTNSGAIKSLPELTSKVLSIVE